MKHIITAGLLPFLMDAMSNGRPAGAPLKPTGGHRAPGHRKTEADHQRLQAAADRRQRRAMKREADYLKCIGNNPCVDKAKFLQSYPCPLPVASGAGSALECIQNGDCGCENYYVAHPEARPA